MTPVNPIHRRGLSRWSWCQLCSKYLLALLLAKEDQVVYHYQIKHHSVIC